MTRRSPPAAAADDMDDLIIGFASGLMCGVLLILLLVFVP